jgi:hypothetical protein
MQHATRRGITEKFMMTCAVYPASPGEPTVDGWLVAPDHPPPGSGVVFGV